MRVFRFSKIQLLAFLLVFAAIGAIILITSHAANPNLPGDITGDGHVDSTDLNFMIANYNLVYPAADFNNSGKVDGSDFATLLKNYGTSVTINPPQWVGDFETGTLSGYGNQSCPGGVTIVTSPVRAGRYAAKFTVDDNSVKANCPNVPTSNPRAQLYPQGSTVSMNNGDDRYVAFSTYFPANFPVPPSWFQVGEVYGPPFGGSPTMGFDIVGNNMVLDTGMAHLGAIWTSAAPIAKGTGWEDIIIHVKFSTDPAVGFVEVWRNGVPQTFKNGLKRYYYTTMVAGVNDGANTIILNQYRAVTPMGSVTIYHDEARIGTTYASVAP